MEAGMKDRKRRKWRKENKTKGQKAGFLLPIQSIPTLNLLLPCLSIALHFYSFLISILHLLPVAFTIVVHSSCQDERFYSLINYYL